MKYQFGEKLRLIRERKGLTLKDVAKRAGLSESLISQIERNRVSPAIDTLLSLVEILEIDLSYIFADFRRERAVQIVHKEDRQRIALPGVRYEELALSPSLDDPHGIQAWLLSIEPGRERGSSEYGHPGRELGIIIQGKGELVIGSKAYEVEAGDSLSFEADLPHVLRNTSDVTLQAYWILTPPRQTFGASP